MAATVQGMTHIDGMTDTPDEPVPGEVWQLQQTKRSAHQGVVERGGRGGKDPTRYGDWEKNGRCIDF